MTHQPRGWSSAALLAVVLVYLHNTIPLLTMLPRINVDEPWLIERAYELATTGAPSQPMFLLNHGYLLQPGQSLLLAPWLEVFGVGLLQSRLLGVLCGLGAVLGVYALGRLLFGTAAGVVAAMFIATDSNFLGIARMARTDAPSMLFVTTALACAYYGLRMSRARWTFAGGLATGFAMLCHANSYWVGVVVFFWYVAVYGWRLVRVPSAYGYGAGLAAGFGPYAAIIAANWDEFNAQLQMFAIERVPGFSVATLWFHISHEPARYRDWYFGLITNQMSNPILWLFQACTVAGGVYLLVRLWRDRRTTRAAARPETFAAILMFGSMTIFAALIPNKALVYLPHLLVGFAVAAGAVVARALAHVPTLVGSAPRPTALIAPAVGVFLVIQGVAAIVLYQRWYATMQATELRPYEETHAIVSALVPAGPKYLISSPTFWLPFYDSEDVTFVAYTAAGPYDTVEPQGFFTRQRIFDFPEDKPFFLLVDEVEWRAVLEDPTYNTYWRESWLAYIREACAPVKVAFGTAHGTLALYRCWEDRKARPTTPEFFVDGRRYAFGDTAWTAGPAELAAWQPSQPATAIEHAGGALRVSARAGGGIYADVPVTPHTPYLLRAEVDGVTASDLLAVHEMDAAGEPVWSRWVKLSSTDWFPAGTIVESSTATLRVYLYSDTATDFTIRSVTLTRLTALPAE